MPLRRLLLPLFLMTTLVSVPAQEEDVWPDAFSRHFTGTLGDKLKIEMQLECSPPRNLTGGEMQFHGQYWYENHREPITLWGRDTGWRELSLEEQVYAGVAKGYEQTGTFKGKLNDDGSISGTWTDGAGKKSFPFKLTPATPAGSATVKLAALESSWTERTKDGTASLEHTATVLQVSGVKGAAKINQTLLEDAIGFFAEVGAEETAENADEAEAKKKPAPKKTLSLDDLGTAMKAERDPELIQELGKWSYTYLSAVQLNARGILSTSHINSEYTGGAHPNSVTGFHTFDTATGKELTLSALFKPGFLKALPGLAKEKLLKVERLKKTADLGADAGLALGDVDYSEEALTWFLSWEGFVVHFNPYDIAPYARGNVQFTIPWAELKPWLTDNSPLLPFLAE